MAASGRLRGGGAAAAAERETNGQQGGRWDLQSSPLPPTLPCPPNSGDVDVQSCLGDVGDVGRRHARGDSDARKLLFLKSHVAKTSS